MPGDKNFSLHLFSLSHQELCVCHVRSCRSSPSPATPLSALDATTPRQAATPVQCNAPETCICKSICLLERFYLDPFTWSPADEIAHLTSFNGKSGLTQYRHQYLSVSGEGIPLCGRPDKVHSADCSNAEGQHKQDQHFTTASSHSTLLLTTE